VLLRATTRRPVLDGPPVSAGDSLRRGARGQSRPIRRRSSNKHLHLAIVIAVAVASMVAIAIPITRTQANAHRSVPESVAARAPDDPSESLRIEAADITAALSAREVSGATASVRPPLGAGLFPEPLLAEAARLVVRDAFPTPESRAALAITRDSPVSFTVHEDGFTAGYKSNQVTVGLALGAQGILAADGDLIIPPLNSELVPGAHVYIRHALDVRLVVAGTEQRMLTHGQTVGDVLGQAGMALQDLDRVTPSVSKPVSAGMTIKVTTVRDITDIVEEPIEYVSLIQYDSQLATGQRMIAQGGEDGAVRREYRVRSVNGQETRRELVSETITPARDEVVSIGTYVRPAPAAVAAAVAAPAPVASVGDMVCSRTLNVYATWYTAASAGGSGITATGTGVYKGIVAVDPRVIPLGTRMYIPGYGYATAADTGGAIRGNHIDLGYGADDVKDWRTRWVDICVL
jgi:3D (Asp-Asp-Asp) domain-containing protein